MPGVGAAPLDRGRRGSLAFPGLVLFVELLVALGDRRQRVLGRLPRLVRAQPVPFRAPVLRLDRVVLEAVEPGSSGHVDLLVPAVPARPLLPPACHRRSRRAQSITWSWRA